MKPASTTAVVGLCGNESRSTRGRGRERSKASTTLPKKSSSGPIAIRSTTAPAKTGANRWIG